jgi:hypothetical protein
LWVEASLVENNHNRNQPHSGAMAAQFILKAQEQRNQRLPNAFFYQVQSRTMI